MSAKWPLRCLPRGQRPCPGPGSPTGVPSLSMPHCRRDWRSARVMSPQWRQSQSVPGAARGPSMQAKPREGPPKSSRAGRYGSPGINGPSTGT
eukprot:396690-Alexandrium_andersonii.AAC.1